MEASMKAPVSRRDVAEMRKVTDKETVEHLSQRKLADVMADLRRPIPTRLQRTRKQGGKDIPYCPWTQVQKLLNHYTNGFCSFEVRDKMITTKHLLVTVRVSIYTIDGLVYRDGTGIEELTVDSYGDTQSNAVSMAFRRACARFGLGLSLYEK